MRTNETYVTARQFRTINAEDVELLFETASTWKAASFDVLISVETGEVVKLPRHVARNPSWYFRSTSELARAACEDVSHSVYVRELVRGNEGLDLDCLWRLGELEGWLPCVRRPASRNVFSACLSSHPHVEVRLDGVKVRGTTKERGHLKGFTYHAKRA